MDYELNPFQVLYVTDSPDPNVFVDLFSDVLIKHTQAIFKSGNVVVRGIQGAGKSMLLNLLRPQIRLAYAKAGAKFPVPTELSKFIGAGVNLTRSGILDIGQLPIGNNPDQELKMFPLFFADFLNYFLVLDILRSLKLIAKESEAFDHLVSANGFDRFAEALSNDDCWFGYLSGCKTLEQLESRLLERIGKYRAFHQCNIPALPDEIQSTKSSIGEPVSRTEEILKQTGIIDEDTSIIIRIDQVERLLSSDVLRPELGVQYRRMINKLLSLRDSRISYCIGIRTYAWDNDLTIYETNDKLEHIRDFRFVDLDELLRRQENRKTWVFPSFAEDAFFRRLKHAGLSIQMKDWPLIRVFGRSPTPEDVAVQAKKICDDKTFEQAIESPNHFPDDWARLFSDLYLRDPLESKLAMAWSLQRGRSGKRGNRLGASPPENEREPWKATYWRKDRDRMALRQIEAKLAQRSSLHGKSTIVGLSAGNISVFVSVCHEIWDAHLRAERRKSISNRRNPVEDGIPADLQAVGIQTASQYWHDKIVEQPRGHDRKRFIDVLGRTFRRWLLGDVSLSYPGHNGFSLTIDELDANPEVARFLQEAADYGDLFESEHTTKEKDRKPRIKWYLMPILSDYFQISETHTREPCYATIGNVIYWLKEADIRLAGVDYGLADSNYKRSTASIPPRTLFD